MIDLSLTPDAYLFALQRLDVSAKNVLSIEDNPDGVLAATKSGTRCLVVPGSCHDASSFANGSKVQEFLDVEPFLQLHGSATA